MTPQEKEINQKLLHLVKQRPKKINTIDELYDWKEYVWEKQYHIDPRVRELFENLSTDEQDVFLDTILYNPYIPHTPYFTQIKLLTSAWEHEFALFGGGRGGGKTDTFLMAGVQFVEDFPEWKAGILRLTSKHLTRLGAVLDRARRWFTAPYLKREGIEPTGPGESSIYKFPSGAGLMFGHVQHDSDVEIYQGAELHRLLIEEAVQFTKFKITGLKGSIRKLEDDPLPINIWYNGNPGGVSHDYFNNGFVKGSGLFIPSLYTDNPYLDHNKYEEFLDSIAEDNPVLGRQWKHGDWEATPEGKMFKRRWFRHTYTHINEQIVKRVRLWDLAATDPEDPSKSNDPDWTAGCLLLLGESGRAYLDDMRHFQEAPDTAEAEIFKQAEQDTRAVKLRIELEGGASPRYLMNIWSKKLPGYDFEGWNVPRKDKITRAQAMVSFIKNGNLWIREDPEWNDAFLAEISSFPTKNVHDDQVDALSGAYSVLFNLKNSDYDPPDWEDFEEYNE